MLTKRQQQALDFIAAFQAQREGRSPTFREIKDGLGLHSCGYVGNIVKQLEAAGCIRRSAERSRNIEIVSDEEPRHYEDEHGVEETYSDSELVGLIA